MFRHTLFVVALALCVSTFSWAGQWTPLGPEGGDVRSLSYDPHNPDRIFLGTSSGQLFVSQDGGASWSRFAHLGSGDDYVLDHVVVDPRDSNTMYVSAWSVEDQHQAGDLFITHDGGRTWQTVPAMHGKSLRALAQSVSNPNVLVVGALDGVYRSNDDGKSWEHVSPANHAELKNIESIAVDPRNPDVIYAGTWHLAWKTDDGGRNWHPIHKGMIDDSDVFSIIVDGSNSSNVYASACSGIYKSEEAGELFHKIQGMPFSARRTRVLKQDPVNPSVVFAGTTEGLWKTMDAGKSWRRVTNPGVVVNDVFVDPRNDNRVLLATNRMGVLASNDGAQNFVASNQGFSHRIVTAVMAEKTNPNTIFVGMVNDREFGGVFVSHDGGVHWQQKNAGLDGRDVFTLQQAGDGVVLAGTNRGMFKLEGSEWRPMNEIVVEKEKTVVTRGKNGKRVKRTVKTETKSELNARVTDIDVAPGEWFAATSDGLFHSTTHGKFWVGGPVLGQRDLVFVRARGETMVTTTRHDIFVSKDGGKNWEQANVGKFISKIHGVTITPDGDVWVASKEGAFHSVSGANFEHVLNGLPYRDLGAIAFDDNAKRLIASSDVSGEVFQSRDNGRTWQRAGDSGWPIRSFSVVRGRVLAATPFDGVIAQPPSEANERERSGSGGGEN